MAKKVKRLSADIEAELHMRARVIALQQNRSLTEVIEELIAQWVKDNS